MDYTRSSPTLCKEWVLPRCPNIKMHAQDDITTPKEEKQGANFEQKLMQD